MGGGEKGCAACRAFARFDLVDAVDGQPLEVCTACGHVAPDIAAAYPQLAVANGVRRELLALSGHSPRASLCLAVANLFTDVNMQAEGGWALRAARLDEDAGNIEAANAIRRRAATCFGRVGADTRSVSEALTARANPLDEVLRIILDEAGPPPTVGALEQAIGLELAEAHVAANAEGRIVLTGSLGQAVSELSATYVVRRPITSLQQLRARPLESWSLALRGGRIVVELRLHERFGAPREEAGAHVYGAWTVTPTGQACTVSYVEPPRS